MASSLVKAEDALPKALRWPDHRPGTPETKKTIALRGGSGTSATALSHQHSSSHHPRHGGSGAASHLESPPGTPGLRTSADATAWRIKLPVPLQDLRPTTSS